jgi:hypothetical protein
VALAPGCTDAPVEPLSQKGQEVVVAGSSLAVPTAAFEQGAILAASEWLEVGDRVVVGAPGMRPPVSNSGSGQVRIGVEAQVGDVFSAGFVRLEDRSIVQGRVLHTGSLSVGNSVTTGGTTQGPIGPLTVLNFPATNFLDGVASVMLEPGQQRTLPPGDYGTLAAKTNTVVRLSTGTYRFREWMIEPGARFELDSVCGPVRVLTSTSLYFRGAIAERADSPRGGAGIVLEHLGTNTAHIEAPFVGSIAAPRAELILNATTHTGRFFARRLRVQAGARIVPGPTTLPGSCAASGSGTALPECQDGLCCVADATKAHATACGGDGVAACIYGGPGGDALRAVEWGQTSEGHVIAFGGPGADRFDGGERLVAFAGGDGDDIACSQGSSGSYLVGGAGSDYLRTTGRTTVVHPGPGADVVDLGPGDDFVVIASLCEIAPGDRITDAGGTNVIYSPVTRATLEAAGLSLVGNFEVELTPQLECHASCGGHLGCPLSHVCSTSAAGEELCDAPRTVFQELEAPTRDGLYASAPLDVRTDLFRYLDAGTPQARYVALQNLRRRRDTIRAAVLDEIATLGTAHHELRWKATNVGIVGALGGREGVPYLRDWASATLPNFPVDQRHNVESQSMLAGLVCGKASYWLARTAHAGMAEAEVALEEVLSTPTACGLDQAVTGYRTIGDSSERRTRLRALLGPSQQARADFELVRLDLGAGPQPPSSALYR